MPTHFNGSADQVRALDSYIKLTRAADSINSRLNISPSMSELTISQFGVLEALFHLGPQCQNVLGNKILKSNSNMTTVIDNLEKRDLVKRERSLEDRRMITIILTEKGKALIEKVLPQHVASIAKQFEVLTPEEHVQLGEILRKLGKQG